MDTLYLIMTIVNLALIALALAVLARLLFKGELSERHLALGPIRDLHQPAWVYVVGVLGVLAYGGLKLTLGNTQEMTIQLLIEVIPYVMIGLMLGRSRVTEAGFRKIGLLPRWPGRDAWWGLAGGAIGLGLAGAVGLAVNAISTYFGSPVDQVAHEALKTLRGQFSVDLLLMLIISAVVMAPIVEELLFRGVLQTSLLRLLGGRRWPALVITSAVFSIIHWWAVPWQGLIPLFVLGLVFGYLYERTGSLLTPMIAHAVFNAANIAIALSLPEQPPIEIV